MRELSEAVQSKIKAELDARYEAGTLFEQARSYGADYQKIATVEVELTGQEAQDAHDFWFGRQVRGQFRTLLNMGRYLSVYVDYVRGAHLMGTDPHEKICILGVSCMFVDLESAECENVRAV